MEGKMGYQSVLLSEYLEESEDLLNEIEQVFLDLESNCSQDHLWDCLMRNLHSFKGSAQLMGLDPIVAVAHGMETLVTRFRQLDQEVDSTMAEMCYECIDMLRQISDDLEISGACNYDVSPVLAKIDEFAAE